ncbi:class I SAM-dependent methyltransferase [Allosphingosinicella flava]|uniref:Class I SAM-dependent methyltransferase n=1 Tax=Allosphingosinicella flava TaxID=2771430 RepID=A0A7T2LNM7_9SPHN|nr:cyclopropane-fatty-acyl-phospholipid synthase family protein [Sphingosinicella flava]QPQ56332.1 class I SAM-dependent methyltransferase [Sphingosinicella flava]
MRLMDRMLDRIVRQGELTVTGADGSTRRYGSADPSRAPVAIRFTDARVPFDIVRDPRLGAGEAYMNGRLVMERGEILDLLDLVRSNGPWDRGSGQSGLRERAGGFLSRLHHLNWQRRSKRNVAHHYDLSDRLYDLFLDADRQYSCAYFTDPANDLDTAQADKKAHIAAKLHLKPGQKVLDIGCGWGGMALYLNRVADVDVLGITLSEEQLKVARRRAEEAGAGDRVQFELVDYRAVTGRFDRIVSVGMFEHVGPPHYRTFFRKCRELLAEDGVMLLHTIGRMGGPGVTDAWTAKYIFPGGYNPALSEIVAASEREKMIVADVETLRLHYALTLAHWYRRVTERREEIVALYDDRFFRMWQFYLAGAIVAFRHGGLVNYQLQYIRRRDALPLTRDYIAEAERALRA